MGLRRPSAVFARASCAERKVTPNLTSFASAGRPHVVEGVVLQRLVLSDSYTLSPLWGSFELHFMRQLRTFATSGSLWGSF